MGLYALEMPDGLEYTGLGYMSASTTAQSPEWTFEQHKLIDQTMSDLISGSASFDVQSPEQRQRLVSLRNREADQLAKRQNTNMQRLEGFTPEDYVVIRTGLIKMSNRQAGPFSHSQIQAVLTQVDEYITATTGQQTQSAAGTQHRTGG